ncbi:unnamed protein product [Plutella xylostella]|uniref:(diamondback moth) hypothetical protein n=1 Tax=Plutella xylostella TaxID=51655 RepID=A0A8S4G404_PLUXY|nr:unnamed protein product [Plutella xylostella]
MPFVTSAADAISEFRDAGRDLGSVIRLKGPALSGGGGGGRFRAAPPGGGRGRSVACQPRPVANAHTPEPRPPHATSPNFARDLKKKDDQVNTCTVVTPTGASHLKTRKTHGTRCRLVK